MTEDEHDGDLGDVTGGVGGFGSFPRRGELDLFANFFPDLRRALRARMMPSPGLARLAAISFGAVGFFIVLLIAWAVVRS